MPNALVTGLAGQDGRYMAHLLMAKGYRVTGSVRPGSSIDDLPGVQVVEADVRDDAAVKRAVRVAEPDEIYNFAGVSSLAEADADPDRCHDVNAGGLERLLAASPKTTRICQASSALIFGPPDGSIRDESTAVTPVGPYAQAKAEAHRAIGNAREAGRFAASAILFNHESPLRSPRFVTRKVTMGVAQIKRGERGALNVGNLAATRDWGFAGDYVRAMWMMLQQSVPADLVIATGVDHTVADLVRTAFEVARVEGWETLVEATSDRAEPWSPADPSRARKMLGWEPEVDFHGLVAMMVRHDLDTV